ncbi:MAG: hypothetical protein DMG97_38935 [Acidobacteria bacterium]|nr:MAG: hypothetical protein DMG97_38935 [Acidobacteriota bacterium]PYX28221.1 MAG: hypothetical protein DMG77_16595 [Acidobacteriota bacterium]
MFLLVLYAAKIGDIDRRSQILGAGLGGGVAGELSRMSEQDRAQADPAMQKLSDYPAFFSRRTILASPTARHSEKLSISN